MKRHSTIWITMFLVSSGAQLGCSSNDEYAAPETAQGEGGRGGEGGGGGGGGEDPTAQSVAWKPCPVVTGGDGAGAECAEVEVPLEWSSPEGDTITVFVKRLQGAGQNRRQVWMLAGGPGGAGVGLEPFAEKLRSADPSVDVYLPDHRGTGRSTLLSCTDDNDLPNCIESLQRTLGDKLAAFNTTNAAQDLGALIERTRTAGQDVHVYGVSYGTLWAQRYLQLFPEQPTGVTLDGTCQNGLCSLFHFDYWHNQTGLQLMDLCARDAFCASKLGEDPTETLGNFLDGLDSGSCPELAALGMDRDNVRKLFAVLVQNFDARALIPALVYRGQRCAPGDIDAWRNLGQTLFMPQGITPLSFSMPLAMNIALSELVELDPPSLQEIEERDRSFYFSMGQGPMTRRIYDIWPRYARDAYAGKYPSTDTPMLILNGTMDPQTPIDFANQVAPNYDRPHQTFVAIPQATHATVLRGSKLASDPTRMCGWDLWTGFMTDVTAPVDTSCVDEVQRLTFEGNPELSRAMLGTDDMWGDGSSARRESPESAGRAARETVQQIAQRLKSGAPWVP